MPDWGRIDRRSVIAGLALAPAWLSAAAAPLPRPAPAELHALIIGNDRYRTLRPLERAVADARSIAARVQGFGYQVMEVLDADTDAIFAAFAAFRARLTRQSAAFVYFAGHGLQVNGTNFLLPLDVDSASDARLLQTSLPLAPLLDDLAAAAPAQAIVMLDACRDNPVQVDIPGRQPGFASVQAPGGFYIAYSAGSGELALDRLGPDDPDPNGLFMRCLLAHLAPDRSIDAIMKETRCQVAGAAEAIGHPQHPAIYDQSRFELRLDGSRDPGGGAGGVCSTGAGRLHNTAVLLIANESYSSRSIFSDLATPRADAHRLQAAFKGLGAETMMLTDAGRERIREACATLAGGGHDRIIVHYGGAGLLVGDEATMLVVDPAAPARGAAPVTRGIAEPEAPPRIEGIDCVFLAELIEWLRPPPPAAPAPAGTRGFSITRRGPNAQPKPQPAGPKLLCLLDFCLSTAEIGVERPASSALAALQNGFDTRYDHVAVLTSGGIFQSVLDEAEGQGRSPFALALQNALARPGLSLGQFAAVVRDEVEAITKGFQTPALFARSQRRGDRLVERLGPLA